MAKKIPPKKPLTIAQRFTSVERLVRSGFRQSDARFRRFGKEINNRFKAVDQQFENSRKEMDNRFKAVDLDLRDLKKNMDDRFTVVEERIDRLAIHIDGFIKLHETLVIELRVMKEQMNRFEERLTRLEAAQAP